MKLYWNQTLIDPQAGEDSIHKALAGLDEGGDATVELRRSPGCRMRVSRLKADFLLEVEENWSMVGLLVSEDDHSAVRAALLEFRRGSRPRMPWDLLHAKAGGLAEFVAGNASEHDCMLCALQGAEAGA